MPSAVQELAKLCRDRHQARSTPGYLAQADAGPGSRVEPSAIVGNYRFALLSRKNGAVKPWGRGARSTCVRAEGEMEDADSKQASPGAES